MMENGPKIDIAKKDIPENAVTETAIKKPATRRIASYVPSKGLMLGGLATFGLTSVFLIGAPTAMTVGSVLTTTAISGGMVAIGFGAAYVAKEAWKYAASFFSSKEKSGNITVKSTTLTNHHALSSILSAVYTNATHCVAETANACKSGATFLTKYNGQKSAEKPVQQPASTVITEEMTKEGLTPATKMNIN